MGTQNDPTTTNASTMTDDPLNQATPGRWHTAWSKAQGLRICAADGSTIATVAKRPTLGVDSWNGALLASSPRLRDALRTLLYAGRDGPVLPRDFAHQEAMAALAEAGAASETYYQVPSLANACPSCNNPLPPGDVAPGSDEPSEAQQHVAWCSRGLLLLTHEGRTVPTSTTNKFRGQADLERRIAAAEEAILRHTGPPEARRQGFDVVAVARLQGKVAAYREALEV